MRGAGRKQGRNIFMIQNQALTILVADDDESVRTAFSKLLTLMGYVCDMAKDGADCLEKLKSKKYDLLMIDLVMPGMDGETVLSAIKGHYTDMDIIVISAQDDEDVIGQILHKGSCAYLVKPVMPNDLQDVVKKIAQKRLGKKI